MYRYSHSVTPGGTGKTSGDRHPKIRQGVLLSAGCKVIGNIQEVGCNAKAGAGSVVLNDVPPNVTVAGIPAKSLANRTARSLLTTWITSKASPIYKLLIVLRKPHLRPGNDLLHGVDALCARQQKTA